MLLVCSKSHQDGVEGLAPKKCCRGLAMGDLAIPHWRSHARALDLTAPCMLQGGYLEHCSAILGH